MADSRRERERRRPDKNRRSLSRSRSRSPRNRRMGSRSPKRNTPPRPVLGKQQRERETKMEEKPQQTQNQVKIDREKTCPLLLRVFYSDGRHNRLEDYSRSNVPKNELQIYTWKDATLKELMNLVKEVNPKARRKGTFFDFATVFPDARRSSFIMKDIGSTCTGIKSPDDNVTLAEKKFQIGDFLDIAISTPRERRDFF